MDGYLTELAFAALPAVGNFAGGVLAEVLLPSRRMLSLALHAAAGVVLSVVAVELMPQAIEAEPPWLMVLSFVLGGCSSSLWTRQLESRVPAWDARAQGTE